MIRQDRRFVQRVRFACDYTKVRQDVFRGCRRWLRPNSAGRRHGGRIEGLLAIEEFVNDILTDLLLFFNRNKAARRAGLAMDCRQALRVRASGLRLQDPRKRGPDEDALIAWGGAGTYSTRGPAGPLGGKAHNLP